MTSDAELVRAYREYYRTDDADLAWSFDELCRLVTETPERAWPIVVTLVHEAADEYERAYVAAGPLEDILCHHGPAMWPRIHVEARRDPLLREALRGVWGHSRMDPEVYSALQAFLGPVLPPRTPSKR